MDRLWSPWRYTYLTQSTSKSGCIFCEKAAENDDEKNFIVHRDTRCFVMLNLYPYNNGHVMIAPYAHIATLEAAGEDVANAIMRLTRATEQKLRSVYKAPGYNLGMNIGESAGAGVAGHIHMHVVPRWPGDANFMSTIGETRVLPEDLHTTWGKLRDAFAHGR
jgi:ATP adenylyltransferase